jgi:hypothetical protein
MRLISLFAPFLLAVTIPSVSAAHCKPQINPKYNDRNNTLQADTKPALDAIPSLCQQFAKHGKWHKGDKDRRCAPYYDKARGEWHVWVFIIQRIHHALPHEKKLKKSKCRKYLTDPVLKCNGYGGNVKASKFEFT